MGVIPPADLLLLRQPVNTQTSLERLYIMDMNWVWHGRVNETPTRGDRTITFDGGEMNDLNPLADEPGDFRWRAGVNDMEVTISAQTISLWTGLEVWFSATGYDLKDKGVRRLRTMTSADFGVTGTIDVDWFDDMSLAENDFITVKHFYPPWPKYSYFTAAGPVFYKDGPGGHQYATANFPTYTDPNENPAPHVIMGRHYAGELSGASITIQCDATNTVDVAGGGDPPTYKWALTPYDGAAPFSNDAVGSPTLTIDTAGPYWIHGLVEINDRVGIGHRAVIVGGGLTEFARSPITSQYDKTDINVTLSLTSPETGATGAIRGVMDWTKVQDHTLAIITATDYYGSTQKTISYRGDPLAVDVYDDRQHIVFCGYLALENMDLVEDGSGRVELQAVSLVDMFLYSLSLTGVTAADQWYEMLNTQMTVAGNLLHLLRWHSTLLDIADWWLPWTDTVRRSANEEFSEGDMLERGRELARARLMGVTANPQGEIFVETDLNLRNAVDRAAEFTTLILTEADIAGAKRARTRRRGDSVRVLADGGYSTGVMGSFQPFFAASQNVAKAEARPALVHIDRLMFPNQAEANRVAARLAAVANRRYIEVDLDFSGNYREVFSPADQQWTDLGNLFAATLIANISDDTGLVDALCVPRQVTHAHDNATGQTTVSVIFDVEAPVELEGRTITPPAVPSEDPDDGTWDFPDIPEWPAIPDVTLLTNLLAFDSGDGCWLRFSGAADWTERNGTRAGADDADLQGGWDPWWFTPAKHNTTDVNQSILWACQVGKIWRSIDGGQTWLDMSPNITDPPNSWADGVAPTLADLTFIQRADNIHYNKEHYFIAEWQNAGGDWRGWLLKTDDDGTLGSWEWVPIPGSTVNDCATCSPLPCYGINPASCPAGCGSGSLLGTGWRTLSSTPGTDLCGDALPSHRIYVHFDMVRYISTRNAAGMTDCGVDLLRGSTCDGGLIISTNITTQTDMEIDTLSLTSSDPFTIEVNIGDMVPSGETRPIWMDVDSESGNYLYLTMWDGANLRLYVYGTDLLFVESFDLGAATEGQVAAKTYIAYPYTPTFDQDTIYVFGRMQGPVGLADPSHLIRTINAGVAWAAVESGWGADYMSAFRAEGDTTGTRQFYAVRSGAGVAQFYSGLESLVLKGNTSFGAGAAVYVDALSINGSGQVAIGSNTAAATMITVSDDNGATWSDVTDSFPATGSVSSLTYI